MLAILTKFRNLSEISFHGNKISNVPSLDCLKNLRAIDLSNNPIKVGIAPRRLINTFWIDCTNLRAWSSSTSTVRVRSVRQLSRTFPI
jgi:hypothetical protein